MSILSTEHPSTSPPYPKEIVVVTCAYFSKPVGIAIAIAIAIYDRILRLYTNQVAVVIEQVQPSSSHYLHDIATCISTRISTCEHGV